MATPSTTTRPASVRDITPRRRVGRTSNPSSESRNVNAYDVVAHRGIGSTLAYSIRQKTKFDFQKKVYQLGALSRLHRDISGAFESTRDKHLTELEQLNKESLEDIQKPSLIRYGIYGSSCILIDLLGVVLAAGDATGVGLIATILVGILVTLFMWLWGRIVLGSGLKKAKAKRKELRARTGRIANDIQLVREQYNKVRRLFAGGGSAKYPRLAARFASAGSRIGSLATKSRFIVRTTSVIARVLRWKPLVWIGENIPAVRAWPFWTIAAAATYIEHRAEYKLAQELLAQYNGSKTEVVAISDATFQIQRDVVEQDMLETAEELETLQAAA